MNLIRSSKIKSQFLIAAPRSGTTWMSTMLNAHPKVYCVERRLFGNYADFVNDEGVKTPRLRVTLDKYVNSLLLHHGLPHKRQKKLVNAFIRALQKQELKYSGKKHLVDKITPYLNTSEDVIRQISYHFPKSKIIYLVRDGRDVLTSGVFHWFNKQKADETLSDFELIRRQHFSGDTSKPLDRFFQDKEIAQWANEWAQPLRTIESAQQAHEVKIVAYEDLLHDTKKALKDCLDFLNIKASDTDLEECVEKASFKNMSDGRVRGEADAKGHVRKGIAGDWKNYFTKADAKLFDSIAGDLLVKFGYEKDNLWIENHSWK